MLATTMSICLSRPGASSRAARGSLRAVFWLFAGGASATRSLAVPRSVRSFASIARSGEITATNGVIDQSNFHDYPVARIHEASYQTNVYVVESSASPSGVGEPGVSVIAPALCNAIFAATGRRIRELPFSKALPA